MAALLLAGILLFSAAAERPQPTLAQTERRAVIRVAGDFVIHDALIRSAQALGGGEAYEFSLMLSPKSAPRFQTPTSPLPTSTAR